MASYRIEIKRSARKEFLRLPGKLQRQITKRIKALAETPRPPGFEKLADALYRVRHSDHRIVYEVDDTALIVTVTRIANRREVYRRL